MPAWLGKSLICIAAAALALLAPPARAQDYAAIVVDAQTGAVLQSIDAHARWYPASLTKVMTVYLALEAIEAGRLKLDEELTVSEHAAAQPPTELGIGAGDKITVEQAILAIILQSANDVAVALAERLGGTEEAFAKSMTAKAQELGMARTQFRNATGLPDPDQVTTARDMTILGKALIDNFPQHYHFFSSKSFSYAGHTFGTINGILSRYPGADGIKTGFTCGSGYNLLASAVRDGRRLIGVLLGGISNEDRHGEMIALLDKAYKAGVDGGNGKTSLAQFVPSRDDTAVPPPFQLAAFQCTVGTGSSGTEAALGGNFGGWGIIFGSFPRKGEAQNAIRKARQSLRGVLTAGRPVVVARHWEGIRRYNALIVGLSQKQAGRACKHLWNIGAYCLALNPKVLNNPAAAWR
jgi:D-alanyl-D-alanine carboxypeptidase